MDGAQRLLNIEEIYGLGGNDILDLTSPDYSLVDQNIKVDGGTGNDIIWGSDANETILGGEGNDQLFGGIGTDILTGGNGADEFHFTKTSTNSTITDFDVNSGDTLKFFNKGGADFKLDSIEMSNNNLKINYGGSEEFITIGLENTDLSVSEIISHIEIIT